MAGPVIDGLTVDEAIRKSVTTFAGPSSLLIFFICWWSLGSFVSGAVVFLTAAFCQATLSALIYFNAPLNHWGSSSLIVVDLVKDPCCMDL